MLPEISFHCMRELPLAFLGIARKWKTKGAILSLLIFNIFSCDLLSETLDVSLRTDSLTCLFNIAIYLFRLRDLSLQYLMLQWSSCKLREFVKWKFFLLLEEFCFLWKRCQEHFNFFFFSFFVSILFFFQCLLKTVQWFHILNIVLFCSAEVEGVIRSFHITRRY